MHEEFECRESVVAFATAVDVALDAAAAPAACSAAAASTSASAAEPAVSASDDAEGATPSAQLERMLQRSIAAGAEGLMVKRLDSPYEPSTKRWDSWLKLKKDYIEGGAAGGESAACPV